MIFSQTIYFQQPQEKINSALYFTRSEFCKAARNMNALDTIQTQCINEKNFQSSLKMSIIEVSGDSTIASLPMLFETTRRKHVTRPEYTCNFNCQGAGF